MSKKSEQLADEVIRLQDNHISQLKELIESQKKIIDIQDEIIVESQNKIIDLQNNLIEILKVKLNLEEL